MFLHFQVNEGVATGNAGGSLANLLRIGQACPYPFSLFWLRPFFGIFVGFSELIDTLLEQVMTVLF